MRRIQAALCVTGVLILVHADANGVNASTEAADLQPPLLGAVAIPVLHIDRLSFKDLNRSGQLEPYEDWRLPPEVRTEDLLGRMTLAEKAGAMVHAIAPMTGPEFTAGKAWNRDALEKMVLTSGITTFINELKTDPAGMAQQANLAQAIAERGRLGIPLTFSSDPRNFALYSPSRFVDPGQFSQWPMATGLAATNDENIVRRSGDAARQENRAVGIHVQLGPSLDIASDPRWARLNESFGRDARLGARMAKAYVEGVQGGADGLHRDSVVATAKHWIGYGASRDGFDGLNHYGRYADWRGVDINERLMPFHGAFNAHVGSVMTAYSIPPAGIRVEGIDQPLKRVGAAFSDQLINQLLRQRIGFQGVVMTDWFVVEDCDRDCAYGNTIVAPTFRGFGTPWGVESLTKSQRFKLAIDAGIDQFGGSNEPQYITDLVRRGEISESRIDASVRRILLQKFRLGLFENALTEEKQAPQIVGNPVLQQAAQEAQQRATVLLKNTNDLLPLRSKERVKVHLTGIAPAAARRHGLLVVSNPDEADVALMRLTAPFDTVHPHYVVGALQHEGSLAFSENNKQLRLLQTIAKSTPVVASVFMDRPAVLHTVMHHATALLVDFGIDDDALISLLTSASLPSGKLPFALPVSMAEAEESTPEPSYAR